MRVFLLLFLSDIRFKKNFSFFSLTLTNDSRLKNSVLFKGIMIQGRIPKITIKFSDNPDLPAEEKKVILEIQSEKKRARQS